MGMKCLVAMTKCLSAFGSDRKKIGEAIHALQPGTDVTSCHATMVTLGNFVAPGQRPKPTACRTPAEALTSLRGLLQGDEVIFVDLKPDHHFILFPLDGKEMGLLQGFESDPEVDGITGYGLYDWINSGKCKMPIDAFLDNFKRLFATSPKVRKAAAKSLFSISGSESYVGDWFATQTRLTNIYTVAMP